MAVPSLMTTLPAGTRKAASPTSGDSQKWNGMGAGLATGPLSCVDQIDHQKRRRAVGTLMLKRVVGISTAALLIMAVAHDARAELPTAPPTSTLNKRKDAASPLIREAQSKNPAAAAPAVPPRTETIVYDSWTVTCHEGGTVKKTCLATLQVLDKDRKVLLRWQIGFDKTSRLTTAIDVPTGLLVTDDKTQTRS